MTRQRLHQKARRAKGLCGRDGCKETTGKKYLCPLHAADHAVRMKMRRALAKAAQMPAAA